MSDTSGLPNTDSEGVPAEDRPERFEEGQGVSEPGETGVAPEGAEDVTTADADSGTEGAEPPPADFDPAADPSNPDLVSGTNASEPPD